MKRDTLFSSEQSQIKEFEFNSDVAEVFDDMIERSVPRYKEVQSATAALAFETFQPDSNIYDLGCSTGTTLIELRKHIKDSSVKIIGIDNSNEMLIQCKEKLYNSSIEEQISLELADINNLSLENASVVIFNYTLQFVPVENRKKVLKNIYHSLLPGGILIISEKVSHHSKDIEQLIIKLHHNLKSKNGYSELEISQKRDSLENVLIPLTIEENIVLMEEAGFAEIELYLKWLNFATFVAKK